MLKVSFLVFKISHEYWVLGDLEETKERRLRVSPKMEDNLSSPRPAAMHDPLPVSHKPSLGNQWHN